jgi:hypothetical protein
MLKKILFSLFSLAFLIYLVLPGPRGISDFPSLPDSTKSTLEGDTIQIPNVAAYFSENYRDFVIPFYSNSYQKKTIMPFRPLRLNYPPEFAFTAIKDQTQSTYLEELVYPLRDSLFVNGMEPFDKDGNTRWVGAGKFRQDGQGFSTKVTLRYYPSAIPVRFIVWLGINLSFIFLWRFSRRIITRA